MQVGLDSTATDCIDPQLGESELPPVPPPGWLAIIRLPYPECQNIIGDPILVHTDFRFGEIPFTGTKIHEFWFRSDLGATIHWNLPDGVTGLLQDPWGVGIVSVSMAGQDSFFVPYNLINDLNMILYYVNVIPVEFTSFTASVLQNEKVVQLNWQTATETNNMGFEIERL
ncbi:MAG TPA: T9SS C-terminal target domain-containing protein, partial [Ignavibacteriaceae bacterium]|nr:T9SS C-terminal target domain-containing protein [Ignavibacteriaceae bacterium]